LLLCEAAKYNCFFALFDGFKKTDQAANPFNTHDAAQLPNVAVTVTTEP
jgi:hypothetical protein